MWNHFKTSCGKGCNGINYESTRFKIFRGNVDFTQTTNARIFTVRRAWGLVDAGAEPVFASTEFKSTVSSPNSAHCTYMRSIHAAYMRIFRLQYMLAFASACGSSNACRRSARHRPLQVRAEARALVGCRHSVGDDHRGLSLHMAATAYACQKGSNVRGCVGPAEDTSLKYTFTLTITFTFTPSPNHPHLHLQFM